MKKSGIDEAGLGPILGPYCAGLITLEYTKKQKDPRKLCPAALSDKAVKDGPLAVGDSKKIYSPGKLRALEETVLAFYSLWTGDLPDNAESFIRGIRCDGEKDFPENPEAPWMKELKKCTLPLQADGDRIRKAAGRLRKDLERTGIHLAGMGLQMVPAETFNGLLDRYVSKALVCQRILEPLMQAGLTPGGALVVDRQGGRRYYGEWLVELYPGRPLSARRETAALSRYDVGDTTVDFQVGADAVCFETALASMTAKYTREICMEQFNRYWTEQVEDLKPTAGYYRDGKRFLADLQSAGAVPADRDLLIRKK